MYDPVHPHRLILSPARELFFSFSQLKSSTSAAAGTLVELEQIAAPDILRAAHVVSFNERSR